MLCRKDPAQITTRQEIHEKQVLEIDLGSKSCSNDIQDPSTHASSRTPEDSTEYSETCCNDTRIGGRGGGMVGSRRASLQK